jgi:phage shock protein E
MTIVTREELKEKMDRGDSFKLVEALPETSFREGHLPGAVNIPKGRERELASSLLPDRTVEVIVYCSKFT